MHSLNTAVNRCYNNNTQTEVLSNFPVIILAFWRLMNMMTKITTAVNNAMPTAIMFRYSSLIVQGVSSGLLGVSSDPTGNKADMTNE